MSTMTPQVATQRFLLDLVKRAANTFWQAFTATFGAVYAASGLDVTTVTDLSSGQKFLSGLVVAVLAAALSAGKTTLRGLADARYQPAADAPAIDPADEQALDRLTTDPDTPDDELPEPPADPDQPAAKTPPPPFDVTPLTSVSTTTAPATTIIINTAGQNSPGWSGPEHAAPEA